MSDEGLKAPAFRIQTAMVLFALEEALGTYVVQNAHSPDAIPEGLRNDIESRVEPFASLAPVTQLVQETYLKEVIDLAVSTARDRSEQQPLKRLKGLIEALEVFDIRNAVCHPNRPFPEHFWHRAAALATDPTIENLRLYRVVDAFKCASEGRLIPPPEGWLHQRAWVISNNLPSLFDHEVTGLIARREEVAELKRRLANPRNNFIALVGPGGTGKTALSLEVLREIALDPSALNWIDEIAYVSAKTERLTLRGVESIDDPIDSIESVKQVISSALLDEEAGVTELDRSQAFGMAVATLGSRRVLLCIDNLETLLRDHPEQFEAMVEDLPSAWRVLATSRVGVNGANVQTLGPIKKEGAIKLARDYMSIRGASRLTEDDLGRLVDVCDCNPLAIRLVVDGYAAGVDLATALAQAKDKILEFSYTSLIDQLPEDAEEVLECLFGLSDPLSRAEMGHLLGIQPDQLAEAMNSLLRTSLVTRQVVLGVEKYTLSSSVRDLLLRVPRNAEVRAEVQVRLREQQRLLADLEISGSKDPLAENYIPVDAPDHVRALATRIERSLRWRASSTEQLRAVSELRAAISYDQKESVLHRLEARLLNQLKDRFAALASMSKAVSCGAGDLSSQLMLAEFLRDEERLQEAIDQARPLIDARVLESANVGVRNKIRVIRAYWVTALWMKRFTEVLEATSTWKDSGELRPALAALRVSTLQRLLDEASPDIDTFENAVSEIFDVLEETFRLDGYLGEVVHEGLHALERLERTGRRLSLSQRVAMACRNFIDKHLLAMCENHRDYSISSQSLRSLVAFFRDLPCGGMNPLQGNRWRDLLEVGTIEVRALTEVGYQTAKVIQVRADRGFAFARALDGSRDFYVHRTAMDSGVFEFEKLRLGQLLSILPCDSASGTSGRAWPAKHAMLA